MTYNDPIKKIMIPLCNIKDHKWSIQWLGGEKGWKALHEEEQSKRHFEKCLICGIARDDVDEPVLRFSELVREQKKHD